MERGLTLRIGKEIRAVDEAFRAVVPRERGKPITDDERLDERARPSVGPGLKWDELVPVMQVFQCAGSMGLREPVGDKQRQVKVALVETTFGDGGVV